MTRSQLSWRWWAVLVLVFLLAGYVGSLIVFSGPLPFLAGVAVLLVRRRALRANRGELAIAFAVAANAFNVGASLWFFTVPEGFSIRPMIWNAQVLLVGVITLPLVGVYGLRSFFKEHRIMQPVLALALAIGSLIVGWRVLDVAGAIRGFTVATD